MLPLLFYCVIEKVLNLVMRRPPGTPLPAFSKSPFNGSMYVLVLPLYKVVIPTF